MRQERYDYHSIPIPGGGFVTGLLFHPKQAGLLYARTDVGGVYRYNPENETWLPLMDWVDAKHEAYMQVMSIALDDEHPERLFAVCGNEWSGSRKMPFPRSSALLCSEDYGEHFQIKKVPFMVNGNGPTRSCAEKLEYVDGKLYYASAEEGLFCSDDLGESWENIPTPNKHLVFVHVDKKRHWILLSCTGESDEKRFEPVSRETSLYLAIDGHDFKPLPVPEWPQEYTEKPAGYVAVSYAVSEEESLPMENRLRRRSQVLLYSKTYDIRWAGLRPEASLGQEIQEIYVTFSCAGRKNTFIPYGSFACECGGGTHGKLLRYSLPLDVLDGAPQAFDYCPEPHSGRRSANSRSEFFMGRIFIAYEDLTPPIPEGAGMCGIAVYGDMIYCSTINERYNYLYRSMNKGRTFEQVLNPSVVDSMDFDVPYMKPEYNNDRLLVHWMSCLVIDPFSPDFLLLNTGTGVFASFSASKPSPRFKSLSNGIEETVHLNLYAPPAGEIKVLDIVGDLGGFAFTELDKPCENTFADEKDHRYITCNNADYTDKPVKISVPHFPQNGQLPYIATARGNWTGHTKGGLIMSMDDCKTFRRLSMPYGLNAELDEVCHHIEQPNVNAGWCAMSCDGKTILWTLAEKWFRLPVGNAVRTDDYGETYHLVEVYDKKGEPLSKQGEFPSGEGGKEIKFFADRVNPNWFYGFGERGQVYFSSDKGVHFCEYEMPEDFPADFYFSGVDGAKRGEIRCETGKTGSVYIACEKYGLWHLNFSENGISAECIEKSTVYRVGLGKGLNPEYPALYINGYIEGEYGFYRKNTPDEDWVRINTDNQMYGRLTAISGDPNIVNRVYIATNGRGIFVGEKS